MKTTKRNNLQKEQHSEYVSIPCLKPGFKETRVFTSSKAVVRVHIPDIDDEENERRKKLFKKAAENLFKAILIKEQKAGKTTMTKKLLIIKSGKE